MEFHPLCLLLSFREEIVDELAELMTAHGWYPQEHITLYGGQILDGRHRYLAAQKAGVEPQFMDFEGDNAAAVAFVFGVNSMSRHFNTADKKEYFINARNSGFWEKRDPHRSKNKEENLSPSHQEIADILGVHKKTVSGWEAERDDPAKSIRTETSGNDEWYTPEKYINLARDVMGDIDLDPASCEFSQKVILANKFYTAKDDGLEQAWEGRVWLNPPYSKGLMDKFIAKICDEYQLGGVTQAIVLTSNFTDTEWFHKLVKVASAICLTRGRIRFYTEEGNGNSPTNGHAFFYFGPDPDRFAEVFESVGSIVQRR